MTGMTRRLVAAAGLLLPCGAATAQQDGPPGPPDMSMFAMPSTIVDGIVVKFLPDGFVIRDAEGRVQTIGTICPGGTLGLRPGDAVSVFGGPAEGRIASGAISRIRPDGTEEEVPDGSCR